MISTFSSSHKSIRKALETKTLMVRLDKIVWMNQAKANSMKLLSLIQGLWLIWLSRLSHLATRLKMRHIYRRSNSLTKAVVCASAASNRWMRIHIGWRKGIHQILTIVARWLPHRYRKITTLSIIDWAIAVVSHKNRLKSSNSPSELLQVCRCRSIHPWRLREDLLFSHIKL